MSKVNLDPNSVTHANFSDYTELENSTSTTSVPNSSASSSNPTVSSTDLQQEIVQEQQNAYAIAEQEFEASQQQAAVAAQAQSQSPFAVFAASNASSNIKVAGATAGQGL